MSQKQPKQRLVDFLDADGERRSSIPAARALKLEFDGRAVLTRRGDTVRVCRMRRTPKEPKGLSIRNYQGQKYHYREHLDNGNSIFQLKHIARRDLPIFIKSVTDCMPALPLKQEARQ